MSDEPPPARRLAPSTAALHAALELIGEPLLELAVAANPAKRDARPAPPAGPSLVRLGTRLRAVLKSEETMGPLRRLEVRVYGREDGGGWLYGGCLVLARALSSWLGGAPMWFVPGLDGEIKHVVVKSSDVYIDARGAQSYDTLQARWEGNDWFELKLMQESDTEDGPIDDASTSAAIARVLADRLGPPSAYGLGRSVGPERRSNPGDGDADPYLEWFDSVCGRLPYGRVQEGDDLVRFAGDRRGLHVTSAERRATIERCGLGVHPGRSYGTVGGIEEHEPLYWACLYLRPEDALRVNDLVDRKGYHEAAMAAEEALRRDHPDLKVIWFYPASGGALGTSAQRGEECSFDLEAVGDWLAENAEEVHSFDDQAGGHAVAWIGPNIPASMLAWEDERSARRDRRPRR